MNRKFVLTIILVVQLEASEANAINLQDYTSNKQVKSIADRIETVKESLQSFAQQATNKMKDSLLTQNTSQRRVNFKNCSSFLENIEKNPTPVKCAEFKYKCNSLVQNLRKKFEKCWIEIDICSLGVDISNKMKPKFFEKSQMELRLNTKQDNTCKNAIEFLHKGYANYQDFSIQSFKIYKQLVNNELNNTKPTVNKPLRSITSTQKSIRLNKPTTM